MASLQSGAKQMKIALLGTRGIPACYSGFETFYENLAVRLSERGYSVTVYNRKQYIKWRGREYKGVRLVTFPTIPSKHLDTFFHTFISALHALFQGYDIAYFSIVGNSPLTLFTRLAGTKTILNVDGEDWKREKWHGIEKIYLKICEYFATVFPHIVIADSRVIQKRYADRYNARTVFIPYGASIGRSDNTSYLETYGLQKEKYILFVSRLVPENNAHVLIRAFNELETDFKLVLIGDAPYAEKYKKELATIAKQNTIFTGYLFGEGYRSLSSYCYLFVLPSAVDGTRPVLLDQMGFGNCVLVNNCPANLEVIGNSGIWFDGKTGHLDLTSKLRWLINEPQTVANYRTRAINQVAEFYSWEKVTKKYEALFEELLRTENK